MAKVKPESAASKTKTRRVSTSMPNAGARIDGVMFGLMPGFTRENPLRVSELISDDQADRFLHQMPEGMFHLFEGDEKEADQALENAFRRTDVREGEADPRRVEELVNANKALAADLREASLAVEREREKYEKELRDLRASTGAEIARLESELGQLQDRLLNLGQDATTLAPKRETGSLEGE